jgi:hypothetical protein
LKKALRIDPELTKAYRLLSRLLASEQIHRMDKDAVALPLKKKSKKNPASN